MSDRFPRRLPPHMRNATPWKDEVERRKRHDFWITVAFIVVLVSTSLAIGYLWGRLSA